MTFAIRQRIQNRDQIKEKEVNAGIKYIYEKLLLRKWFSFASEPFEQTKTVKKMISYRKIWHALSINGFETLIWTKLILKMSSKKILKNISFELATTAAAAAAVAAACAAAVQPTIYWLTVFFLIHFGFLKLHIANSVCQTKIKTEWSAQHWNT